MPRIPLDRLELPDWASDLKPLDPGRVTALAAAGERAPFEPIHVVCAGDRYLLVDGRHRVHAARHLGWAALDAQVHAVTDAADAIALASELHGQLPPECARKLAERLASTLDAQDRARRAPPLDPRRRRLLREMLAFLHDKKRVQDARLAQLFDLGDATAARKLRVDDRGLPGTEPVGLHEMPPAVALGVRELVSEGLLGREEVEHLFPLNERERLHLRAERALRALASAGDERVKLKGSRWGPDYRTGAPDHVRLVAHWPDGRQAELDLEEVPGLDRHTIGILQKALLGNALKEGPR